MAIKIGKWYITRNNPRDLLLGIRLRQDRIDNTRRAIDEMLIYDKFTDTTKAFGNVKRTLKFYLSDCDTLEEFDKLQNGSENDE